MKFQSSTEHLLRRLARKRWLRSTLSAWVAAVPGSLAVIVLASAVEALFWLAPGERLILAVAASVLAAGPLLAALVATLTPLWFPSRYTPEAVARELLGRDPEVGDRLLVAVQLRKRLRPGSSRELRDAALEVTDHFAETLDPRRWSSIPLHGTLLRGGLVTSALVVLSLLACGFALFPAMNRLAHPSVFYESPNAPSLTLLMPDTVRVTEGDTLVVAARKMNLGGREIRFRIDDGTGQIRSMAAVTDSVDSSHVSVTLASLRRSLTVSARCGRTSSDTSHVLVIHRPRIARLAVTVRPPAYTGLGPNTLPSGVGDITALPGSGISMRLEASRPLAHAEMTVRGTKGGTRTTDLAVSGERASGSFQVRNPGEWWISLTASDGTSGDDPLRWNIHLIEDGTPSVFLLLPEPDVLIPENLTVPLAVDATDDYGISRMNLRWKIQSAVLVPDSTDDERLYEETLLQPTTPAQGRAEVRTRWSLANLFLLPTDEIHYFVEAWDNDAALGPKRARSETRRLLFPSIEQLLTRSDAEQQQAESELVRATEKARQLEQQLRETLQRLRSNPDELTWEQTQSLQQSLEQQQKTIEQLDQVKETIQQLQQLAEQHGTLSKDLIDKFRQVQELLDEVATPEMRESMKQLQEALQQVDGERVRDALEKLLKNQESMREGLERSLEVLQRLRAERRLDELATAAESLAKRQRDLAEQTQDASNRDVLRLAREQELTRKESDALQKRIEETAADSSTVGANASDSLASIQQEMEQSGLSGKQEQSRQALAAGDRQSASKPATASAQQLERTARQLRKLQQQQVAEGKADVMARMNHLFDGMLAISRLQEELREQSRSLGTASPRYRPLAADQRSLSDAVELLRSDVETLRRRTFFISSTLDAQLELSREAMDRAIQRYTDRNPGEVTGEQDRALTMLHRALLSLSRSQQDAQQASSGTGYDEMMQRLADMAKMQQQINDGSSEMPMPGGTSPNLLAELAARQRALTDQMRSMERQQRGAGAREILGNLEGVAGAMEQVAKDLEDRNVTERTRRLQRRILQRLLDSQRSLQQQDKSRERVSQTAEDIPHSVPGELGDTGPGDLEQRLARAMQDDWDPAWREIIRAYFRALQRDKASTSPQGSN
ncbi:MAG: hypothetical protein V2A56_13890 [bacterium]